MKRFFEYLISDEGFEKVSDTIGTIALALFAILIIYNLFIR
jgi:cbb3-type cytochrome oxidase subunit 3